MTPEELEEIKRLEREATPGPWSLYQYGNCLDVESGGEAGPLQICEAVEGLDENVPANMEFIASARTDIPRLISALEEAWAELAELEVKLKKMSSDVQEIHANVREIERLKK